MPDQYGNNIVVVSQDGKLGWRVKANYKYYISQIFRHKDYIFLFSVVPVHNGTSGMWSTHKFENAMDTTIKIEDFRKLFQEDHDRQIDFLIEEEKRKDPKEFSIQTVETVENPFLKN